MRNGLIALLAIVLCTQWSPSAEQAQKDKKEPLKGTSKLMADKLKNSQLILDGLATGDFDKIGKGAEELMKISKAAEWTAHKTPQYEVHTNNFRRSVETIMAKSKQKNLDGATLAYVDMTFTCVKCHQHTRESRDTSLPLSGVATE